MNRVDLLPPDHRAERRLVLALLAGAGAEVRFDVDADAFLSVAPDRLHPFLFLQLRDTVIPPRLRETLKAAYFRSALHDLRRRADLARVSAALSSERIPFLVLKGPVLAATVYPERAARTMLDLDILVAPEDLAGALRTMAAVGYHVPAEFRGVTFGSGDAPPLLHERPGGPALELHTMLESMADVRNALAVTEPGARRVEVGPGLVVPALSAAEHFTQVAVHMSKKPRFRGELRSLLDVALLLRREPLDWDALLAEWDARAIASWILLAVTLAHELFDAPLAPELARRRPADEPLALAAQQLWLPLKPNVPLRLVFAMTGRTPVPIHAQALQTQAETPRGLLRARAHADRAFDRVRRLFSALARPRDLVSELRCHRRGERLYALLEARPPQHSG
jgi:hypothetical protein